MAQPEAIAAEGAGELAEDADAAVDSDAPAIGEATAKPVTNVTMANGGDSSMGARLYAWAQNAVPQARSQFYDSEDAFDTIRERVEDVEHIGDLAEDLKNCQHDVRSDACLQGS